MFYTDTNTIIDVLDIPVNAVATALKDFFSKRLPPLFSKDIIKELEEIAGKYMVGWGAKESTLICVLNYFRLSRCRLVQTERWGENRSQLPFDSFKIIATETTTH